MSDYIDIAQLSNGRWFVVRVSGEKGADARIEHQPVIKGKSQRFRTYGRKDAALKQRDVVAARLGLPAGPPT